MNLEFTGTIWYWKGPAPFYFASVPEDLSADIKAISHLVTYGWGAIPGVIVNIGDTQFITALFPKDGKYAVPIKKSVRDAEFLDKGDEIKVKMQIMITLI